MIQQFLLSILILTVTLSLNGCIFLAAGAAGVGTAKWLSDKVTEEVQVPRDKVINAANSALKSLDINPYKQTSNSEVTQILGKDKGGKQVWVDIKIIDSKSSRIDVRVGYMDGEADARKILQRIVDKAKSWF